MLLGVVVGINESTGVKLVGPCPAHSKRYIRLDIITGS